MYAYILPSWAEQLLPQLLIEQFDSFPIQCRHIEHMQGGVRFREIEHANTVLLGKIYWSLSVNKPGISCESKTTHDFLFACPPSLKALCCIKNFYKLSRIRL